MLDELETDREGASCRRRTELRRGTPHRSCPRARSSIRVSCCSTNRRPASLPAEADELRHLIVDIRVQIRLRRPGDRAQHGAGDEPLRAHPRPRQRQDDRPGTPRRSAPMPAFAAPISARRGCNEPGRAASRRLRARRALRRRRRRARRRPAGRRRRDRRASSARTAPARPRSSRRSPASSRQLRARSIFAGRAAGGIALEDVVAPGHRARPGGPAHLRQPDRDGEPPARRDRPARQPRRGARTSTASSRRFRSSRERRRQPAGQLSGGEQQQLAIARALLSRPQLLDARRAVARPRPGDRRSGLRAARDDPRRRA